MGQALVFTEEEKTLLRQLYKKLRLTAGDSVTDEQIVKLKELLSDSTKNGVLPRNNFDMNPIIRDMQTSIIISEEIGLKGSCLIGIMLHDLVRNQTLKADTVKTLFGVDTTRIIEGLVKTEKLYDRSLAIDSENFRNLLLSFAEDMRVILIMIADRVNLMRQIKDSPNETDRIRIANEAAYLYAPLAHKLGLYKLKSELEDLSLKYLEHDVYYDIKNKLNETKRSRDAYIADFIAPIKDSLEKDGYKFSIKGRTKSIHSIWHKIRQQKTDFNKIYDLFAIRIILDAPLDKEKKICWEVYSIITDKYKPNPNRLRDWLSVPKSNGYESLHTTVMGPGGKWVEVQIRTRRMDEIAERGLAAHWKYKGLKGANGLDDWLTSVREALENTEDDSQKMINQFKMDLYADEVFVFSPKGDLFKLPKGATILDFAFHIHSKIGCKCTGGKVNGKNVQLRQVLNNGDQVEVITASTQYPKQDWLNIVTTTKARNKIRLELKEMASRQAEFAKEDVQRKFKNRKIDYDEAVMMRLIKKYGYKTVTDFYQKVAEGAMDVNDVVDNYLELIQKDQDQLNNLPYRSAEEFSILEEESQASSKDDVLIIDNSLKGIDFSLSKCCHPIYGDDVFGFVAVNGGIRIHRQDCPNAAQLKKRFEYRIVKARWAGKSEGKQYPITLHVVGIDDIGIVTNLTSIISKEKDSSLRSISIDSHDGLFTGHLTVNISDTSKLNQLIKKLQAVKGVKQIDR